MLMKDKFSKFINLQGKYLTSLLFVLLLGIGQMWGAASTTSDDKTASGTITFAEIGTVSAQNTYWYNGLKFYEQSTNSMSADKSKRWSAAITPCQYGTFTSGVNWKAGAYEMTGLILQAHCLAINVSSACTIEVVVNMSGKAFGESNPVVPSNLKVFWDGTAYNTAYTSSNYKTGTAKTDTTWAQNIDGKYNRMKLSIPVTAEELASKTIDVIKVSYTGSATGTPGYSQAFVYESVKIVPPAVTKYTITYAKGEYGTGDAIANGEKTKDVAFTLSSSTYSREGYTQQGWATTDGGEKAYDLGGSYTANADITLYPFWVSSAATKFTISYNAESLKGQSVAGYPTEYTEGVGIASFDPLADVADFHFNGWSPASIAADATGDKEITATWVAAYNVTFSAGAGSGTVPASFQKWEGGKFNLPGQGSMIAPTGKAFDGWKANGAGDKLAANAEYTMGGAAVQFVAQWKAVPTVLFHYQQSNLSANLPAGSYTATGGTLTTSAEMSKESAAYNSAVPNDLKGGANVGKLGATAAYIQITLTTGKFQEGDTVYICGYKSYKISKTTELGGEITGDDAIATGTAKTDYNIGYVVLPEGVDQNSLYLSRAEGSGTGFAAVKVIRPAAREIASTVITLSDVKVNDHSISSDSLSILKTADAYALTLKDSYADAPVIKFNEHTVITYVEGLPATKETDKVYTVTATVNGEGKWQAQQTINSITYTVTAPKLSSAKVYYYDGATKLGEEVVAINSNPANYASFQAKQLATFVDWYNNADLAEEHKIDDISALTVDADKTVYGKWTYTYAQSVNIEKWVLDNTKTPNSDKTGALISLLGTRGFASNLAYEENKVELDSLNDSKGTGRNYNYLGLKVKSGGKMLDFRLAKNSTVKVKFGNVGTTPLYAINGGEYSNMPIEEKVFTYTATGNDYISIKMADNDAVVFKQIMIDAEIQDVTLPEPTRHAVVLSEAGETEHGTLAVASPEEYNWLAKDVEVTLTVTADEGYYIESVTLNGDALTPTANVYSFAMPNAAANVVATFAEIVPNSVTYMPNGATTSVEYIVDDDATVILGCPAQFSAPENKKFAGWNTETDGSGDAYVEGDVVLSPLTLYAQWREYFVITYKDGDDVLNTEDVFVGEAPAGIADPVKAFSIFQGWTLAGSDEVIDVTTLTAANTVYAKWETIDACYYFSAKTVTADEAITAPANLNNADGGTIEATSGTFTYTTAGVLIAGGSGSYFTVNLGYALQEGSKIAVKMYAGGTSARGLNLRVAGSSSNVYQFAWNPSATEPAQMEYDYEYVVPENSPLIGKKVFYLYRNNNVYLQTVTVKDCAPQDYTVTYMDGAKTLGSEMVYENAHPTAADINTWKKGYELQGWSLTDGGDVVELNTITITDDKTLYAKYAERDCSGKGVKFSMAVDGSKIDANVYYPNTTPAVGDLAVYATVSGGLAQAVNTSTGTTKNFEVKTTPEFKLSGANSHMRILLDCPLAENDTIKFDKTEKITLSFDSLKTKSENIAKATSYYIVPAAYAGEDTIHIWYNNSGVSVNGVQVIRPEIYTVSFNLMGHGSAIADLENVVVGAKISAPTAPTDEDYAFAGWYKENTLENEWNFAEDVVVAATTLYAKWLDKSDATLKSLKYGGEDIALEDGVYVYNISLPSATASVPALTAVANSPLATPVVVDATAFDSEGNATSTVTVTPVVGSAQVYTVNFSKAAALPQVNVTEATTWNFATAVAGSTSLENQTNVVLANVPGITNDATFNSQALLGTFNKLPGNYFQGSMLTFTTEVAGVLTIEFGGTNNNARILKVYDAADNEIAAWDYNSGTHQTKKVFVTAGKVTMKAFEGEAAQNVRIYNMDLSTTADYTRDVTEGRYGTICLPNGGVMVGAALYEVAYFDASQKKIFFDEVLNGAMVAGTPYIFLPEENVTQLKVYYTDAASADAGNANGLFGSYTKTLLEQNVGNYILYNNQYLLVNSGDVYVGENRAYIKIGVEGGVPTNAVAPAPGRRRVAMGVLNEQVITGVEDLNVGDQPVKVMIDGQMFILRGEKMYDAQGRLVK